MNCWYCLDKVAGMRKMMSLTVVYENDRYHSRSLRTLNNVHHPKFYERNQTKFELSCAKQYTRVFSTYSYFFKDFESIEQLANKCIEDDLFFKDNSEEAAIFKEKFEKAVYEFYKTDFHFRVKKKKKVINKVVQKPVVNNQLIIGGLV
jgi:hypothetical protein